MGTQAFGDLLDPNVPAGEEKYVWTATDLVDQLSKVFFGTGGADRQQSAAASGSYREYVRKLFLPAEALDIDVSGKILGVAIGEDEQAERNFQRKSMRSPGNATDVTEADIQNALDNSTETAIRE